VYGEDVVLAALKILTSNDMALAGGDRTSVRRNPKPPRIAELAIYYAVRKRDRIEILSDFRRRYREALKTKGKSAAKWRAWREAIAFVTMPIVTLPYRIVRSWKDFWRISP
jgi:hypothetical protein